MIAAQCIAQTSVEGASISEEDADGGAEENTKSLVKRQDTALSSR